ncbi:bifunctional phosphoribosyl-AMP cyclohydrolase/phosphoribosyl-ATP pyrophosphatase [Candidatus Methanomethylophilus sp. 1R26]|uniref:bifunctional phosphoribosyl-AMP cyclohydrolase/phosphoribosyl-ATP diphosphatase HisIE n=1 Tax=Candidatus Methanomethylophilus sp. 1R26 TaxID=1769296 RepID=UPI0007366898|nr:bifunctional phosphoribosyl-AMP cyclohydrolase/phosphoribosyl-ATP diphosphatase HisIE [Candidatus Methanomethylophilus sp. 1R26]KUE73767.1 bifunctional phosphoribosyl-AMP cyclohydrolase/phosphoribosyl-ATP pyrophosphatase [Candidatus Methanomethylophilus sp. 1R26]WII09780.1 bifunctional phosphoribosyl-AMP cyclohydrolase/phosphoribosyl-ATP diphosphatase HisIE [Methanomassiliicoccales archaeon LGM-DZ1]
MTEIPKLNYDDKGLVPVIVQDYRTNEVLMLAYSNEEAVRLMYETGYTHFWSRSRQKMWKKGEESGHVQRIKSIEADCDADTLLVRVDQTGPACHTGHPSCFFTTVEGSTDDTAAIMPELIRTIKDRKENPSEESYTCKLFSNENKMCKKIVEEAAEVILAVRDHDKEEIASETADLIYHTLVALVKEDVDLGLVYKELTERHS